MTKPTLWDSIQTMRQAPESKRERIRASEVLPVVYEELRGMARARLRARRNASVAPTSLVHQAYARLVEKGDPGWENRAHFLATAAMAMRNLLVERARRKGRIKHGGTFTRGPEVILETLTLESSAEDVLAVEEAIRALEAHDERKGRLVVMRFFGEMSPTECESVLGVSARTLQRDWEYARAWLCRFLAHGEDRDPS